MTSIGHYCLSHAICENHYHLRVRFLASFSCHIFLDWCFSVIVSIWSLSTLFSSFSHLVRSFRCYLSIDFELLVAFLVFWIPSLHFLANFPIFDLCSIILAKILIFLCSQALSFSCLLQLSLFIPCSPNFFGLALFYYWLFRIAQNSQFICHWAPIGPSAYQKSSCCFLVSYFGLSCLWRHSYWAKTCQPDHQITFSI